MADQEEDQGITAYHGSPEGKNPYEDAIKEALQNYEHVGLRTVEKPIKGTPENSSVWDDGKPLNIKLPGVSATDVNYKKSRELHGLTDKSPGYVGQYTYVLGSYGAEWGEDRGEKVMRKPVVLFGGHRDTILGKKSFENGGTVDDGITAYHGSPHDFDQFDINKIGTGEGAQAYGHGLYFAESEPVAKEYRDRLSPKWQSYVDGKRASELGQEAWEVADQIASRGITPEEFLQQRINTIESAKKLKNIDREQVANEILQQERPHIENFMGKKIEKGPSGHMYEVHIDAHPDHFLDWDKPIDEQPKHIQDFARSIQAPNNNYRSTIAFNSWRSGKGDMGYPVTGSLIHSLLTDYGTDPDLSKKASEMMQQHGIHGIKYLDASSRSEGEGTRNYVVFDDKRVKVKRKYALGGMVEGYASGGAVEDRSNLAIGGNPGDIASGGFGTGNVGGGNSISSSSSGTSSSSGYGNDSGMAAARAADRASVAGYSADAQQAGKGFVGGGNGGNYADPRNRAYAEQMAKSARQSYLDANYPESPRLGDLAQPNPAATLKQPNRPSTPTPPSAYGQAAPQPSFPHTPTPFSGYPRDVQNALNPTRPDSSFGGTAIDPTGAQTTDVLKNLGTATDAVTMLNAPGFWGGVTRFVAGTPSQPTPQQESQMAKIFSPDMPIARIGDPSLGARAGSVGSMPSGTTSYGSDLTPSGSSVSRPVTPTPSTAYGGMSSQDSANRGLGSFAGSLGSQGPAQQNAAPRQDFNSAFAAARSGGNKTFNWTNPRTGKTGTYGTQLARKQGGRVPSMSEPDEWLVEKNEPENKPVKKANKQVSKPERNPIVSRALMVSSKKS